MLVIHERTAKEARNSIMLEYLNELHERFFTWCDNTVRGHIGREGVMLKQWRPRKNPDGSYDLVFELAARGEAASRLAVPIPEEFHDLLER
ncbi:MAG: hypothetical protein K6T65_15395, partial [Peptococcaceae bacterium]|nr:hypothetical protein [Peptococcaceae bacterium]